LRLLKENRREYLPFLSSVEQLEKASDGKYKIKVRTNLPLSREQVSVLSGGNVKIDLLSFSEKLNSLYKSEEIVDAFKSEVSKLSFFLDAEIFSLDDKTSECKPINKSCNQKLFYYVKNFLKNGILDWVAESKNPKFLPWDVDNAASTSGLSCLVVPIFSNNRFSGVLAALTNLKYLSEDSFEYRTLFTILNQSFAKLEFVRLRDELNKTYSEYQILQSKLFNDFKFAAIGELTSKSIEEIGSPLQVIMSYSDLLQKENPDLDEEATEFIRSQVHTIKEILDRLGNFINNSDSKPKLYSCSVNTAINDFYKVIYNYFKDSGSTKKYFKNIDLEITSINNDVYKYLNASTVNTGITAAEVVPNYTNIANGLGLFGSKNNLNKYGITVKTQTLDSLKYGSVTKSLNFQ